MAAKTNKHSAANSPERLREALDHAGEHLKKGAVQEAQKSGQSFIEQLLGWSFESKAKGKKAAHKEEAPEAPKTGSGVIELVNFLTHKDAVDHKKGHSEKQPHIEAAMNYSREIAQSSERASKGEMREMQRNIQEIQNELRQLLQSSKVLSMEFAEVATEQTPTEVGKYHINFFDWMLVVIRQARQKVEDSGAWLNVMKGKKGKKGTFSVGNMSQHQAGERTTIQNSAG